VFGNRGLSVSGLFPSGNAMQPIVGSLSVGNKYEVFGKLHF
jgi:hypothetical protein